jgi:hypothetical protein
MSQWRAFFRRPAGLACLGLLVIGSAIALVYSVQGFVSSDNPASLSRRGWFVDSATLQPFEYQIQVGDKIPVVAPSGGRTGYPAEPCYWTRDGRLRAEPYPVLLNSSIGKSEPTFCPDCGRLVKPHAAPPAPGEKPSPTQAEYAMGKRDEGSEGE